MQYVNNDMDELFRRAAENYPLDTRSADWNKVLTALQNTEEEKVMPPPEKNYRRFLWLLLLVPVYFICNRPLSKGDVMQGNIPSSKQDVTTHADKTQEKQGSALAPVITPEQDSKNIQTPGAKTGSETSLPAARHNRTTGHQTASATGKPAIPLKQRVEISNERLHTNGYLASSNVQKKGKKATTQAKESHTNLPVTAREAAVTSEGTALEPFRSFYLKQILSDRSVTSLTPLRLERQDIAGKVPAAPRPLKQPKFYLAIMGGVDFTTIKMQRTDDVGYDYGGLLGYAFNKKWSVEAGIFMDQKSYYSDGKYLTTDKVYRPANSEITDITGTCRMFDISLGGKYTFRRKGGSTFFAAAGISSYIMKTEDYAYTYYYPQSGMTYLYEHTYKNETKNILSIANLSVGYTQKLGNVGDLRIEPYLKLPLKGVGYGELPLLSTGIRAGFVRKLF